MSLVTTPVGSEKEIVAQIRCIFLNPPTNAEVILDFASQAGVERIVGMIGLSNDRMIHVCNKLGFATRDSCYDTVRVARVVPRWP